MVPVENREGPALLSPKGRAAQTDGSGAASGSRHPTGATGCGMFTLLSSVTAALSGLLVGYELGLISGALLQIRTLLALTCHEQEMVVSSLLMGALLASLTGGVLIDKCGRRAAIILSSCLLGLGSLVLILRLSYTVLIVGRIAIGVSISLSSIATCVYIAEIAPQHRRGLLVSLNELMIVIGILFAYISNYAFANISHGWKYMFGLVIPLGILQAIAMYFLPPSPRFLVMKGHEEAASKVLRRLRAISDTTEELTGIKSSLKDEYQYSFWDLFLSKDNMRTRIMIGLTLVFFVQVTGQPNILFYASTVLKSVGFQSNEAASLASTGVGVVKVISTVPATLLVDHVGSKTFLCIGSSLMAASLMTMGIVNLNIPMNFTNICRNHSPINQSLDESVFYGPGNRSASDDTLRELSKGITSHSRSSLMPMKNDMDKKGMTSLPNAGLSQAEYQIVTDPADVPAFLKWLSLASLLIYVAAFSIGLGPMPWLLLSEIFPAGIRGRAMALTSSMNWGINLLISLTFLTVTGKDPLFASNTFCALRTNVREVHSPKRHFTVDIFETFKHQANVPDVWTTQLKVVFLNSFISPAPLSSNCCVSYPRQDVILSIKVPHGPLKDKTLRGAWVAQSVKPPISAQVRSHIRGFKPRVGLCADS
uniref:Solute carrier family 2, facilitated glucose transporter member 12 n=1 Tax=Suricata suricatta TaxID=37032 RepID=A0A673UBJ1_SURSU